jgi:pSer/pThr/pTyr-binding forkhead associated (FHA) protein
MPITVIVHGRERETHEREKRITFDVTQRVVIGRGPGCDVRLPDTTVSHRHAQLHAKGSDFVLVDEGSTNGTFVGGSRVAPFAARIVRSGDMIRAGRVWLEFRVDHGPATRDVAVATRDIALALVARAMAARGNDATARVRVVEGIDQGTELVLHEEGRTYVLGRGERCDLLLSDADVSREQASLVRRGNLVTLRDLGAKNPTSLGGARAEANRDLVWRSPLVVRVGRTVLALEDPASTSLAEIEGAPDEAMGTETPTAPSPPSVAGPAGPATPAPPDPSASSGTAIASTSAEAPAPAPTARRLPHAQWAAADLVVMATAVTMLGLSIAGLFWLLR